MVKKDTICANCGHVYFLHDLATGECIVCDSPEVPLNRKCKQFVPVKGD